MGASAGCDYLNYIETSSFQAVGWGQTFPAFELRLPQADACDIASFGMNTTIHVAIRPSGIGIFAVVGCLSRLSWQLGLLDRIFVSYCVRYLCMGIGSMALVMFA